MQKGYVNCPQTHKVAVIEFRPKSVSPKTFHTFRDVKIDSLFTVINIFFTFYIYFYVDYFSEVEC